MLIKKTKILTLMSTIFLSCSQSSNNTKLNSEPNKENENKQATTNFISVTDIHFNPYSLCEKEGLTGKCASMMQELLHNSGDQWEKIFEKYLGQESPATILEHTNYGLFKNFLNQLEVVAKSQNVEFVVLLGDFLVYNFENKFTSYTNLKDAKSIETFTKHTFSFISESISKKLGKNIEVYPVLGNTDSYVSNYNFDNPSNSNLYKDLSNIWGKNSPQLSQSNTFVNDGGYYSININNKNLKILALNTTMFAREAKSNDPTIVINDYAQKQIDWISNEFNKLSSTEKNTKFLIISHIPVGISSASSKNGSSPVSFWRNNKFETEYINTLNNNKNSIAGVLVGHTHEDIFQIINKNNELASSTTPSLTSTRHDARFKVFKLNKENVLVDSVLYSFNPSKKFWAEESISSQYPQARNMFQIYLKKLDETWKNRATLSNKKEEFCAASDGMTATTYSTCIISFQNN